MISLIISIIALIKGSLALLMLLILPLLRSLTGGSILYS